MNTDLADFVDYAVAELQVFEVAVEGDEFDKLVAARNDSVLLFDAGYTLPTI